MNELGKFMLIGGLIVAAVGALLWLGFGKGWFGQLPGDLHVQRENFSFHFPIVEGGGAIENNTCFLHFVSILRNCE